MENADVEIIEETVMETHPRGNAFSLAPEVMADVMQEGTFRCSVCGDGFMEYNTMLIHEVFSHPTGLNIVCPFCNKLQQKESAFSHVSSHCDGEVCRTCYKIFDSGESLDTHIKSVHPTLSVSSKSEAGEGVQRPSSLQCLKCDVTSDSHYEMLMHQRTHLEISEVECHICNKRMKLASSLPDHVKRHAAADKVEGFAKANRSLRKRKRVSCHDEERVYKIHRLEISGSTSTASAALFRFTCEHCNEHFPNKYRLMDHVCLIKPKTSDKSSNSSVVETAPVSSDNVNFSKTSSVTANVSSIASTSVKSESVLDRAVDKPENTSSIYSLKNIQDENSRKKHATQSNDTHDIGETAEQQYSQFKCVGCSMPFNNHLQLRNHVAKHHAGKFFSCSHCTRMIEHRHFKSHMQMHKHSEHRGFWCKECGGAYSKQGFLDNHIRMVHGLLNETVKSGVIDKKSEDLSKCQVCQRNFNSLKMLKLHMKKHHTEPSVSQYKAKIHSSQSKKKIVTSKEKSKIFVCSVCGKCFGLKKSLDGHKQVHSKDVRNIENKSTSGYEHADFNVSSNQLLSTTPADHKHELSPLECKFCKKRFLRKSNLTCHVNKSHQGKKIKCFICQMEFKSYTNLHRHTSSSHRIGSVYHCSKCNSTFPTYKNYKEHWLNLHQVTDSIAEETAMSRDDSERTIEDTTVNTKSAGTSTKLPDVVEDDNSCMNSDNNDDPNQHSDPTENVIILEDIAGDHFIDESECDFIETGNIDDNVTCDSENAFDPLANINAIASDSLSLEENDLRNPLSDVASVPDRLSTAECLEPNLFDSENEEMESFDLAGVISEGHAESDNLIENLVRERECDFIGLSLDLDEQANCDAQIVTIPN